MAHSVRPFLMFQHGVAEEAMTLYASLFPDSAIVQVERFGDGEMGKAGTIKQGVIRVAGQEVRVFDSPSPHGFDFTPSWSFFVECDSAEEQERAYAALEPGGKVMMPLGAYGFSTRFAWISDRFGVSWQLNLA